MKHLSLSKSISKDVNRIQSTAKSHQEVFKEAKKSGLKAERKMKSILAKQKSIQKGLLTFKTKLVETQKHSQKRLSRSISSKNTIPVKKSDLEKGKSNVKETMKILSSMEKNQMLYQERLKVLDDPNLNLKERLKAIDELDKLTKQQSSFWSKMKNIISHKYFWSGLAFVFVFWLSVSNLSAINEFIKQMRSLVESAVDLVKKTNTTSTKVGLTITCMTAITSLKLTNIGECLYGAGSSIYSTYQKYFGDEKAGLGMNW